MRPSRRRWLLVVLCVLSVVAWAITCDLGPLIDATPTPSYQPRPTPWWPTPSYQPWPTATPEGG